MTQAAENILSDVEQRMVSVFKTAFSEELQNFFSTGNFENLGTVLGPVITQQVQEAVGQLVETETQNVLNALGKPVESVLSDITGAVTNSQNSLGTDIANILNAITNLPQTILSSIKGIIPFAAPSPAFTRLSVGNPAPTDPPNESPEYPEFPERSE